MNTQHALPVNTQVALSTRSPTVNTQVIEVRFGIMVDGRVAEVQAAAVPAVLALDEAHDHLVNARVVVMRRPSERWYHLLDQFRSKATVPDSPPAGSLGDVDEHVDRFAHELFVIAAAFLAAEANDLEDHVPLVAGDSRQGEIRARLDNIVDKVGYTADALIGRIEDGTWQEFSKGVPSRSDASTLDKSRQPTRLGLMRATGKIAWSAAGAIIAIIAFSVFGIFGGWNGPQSMMIIVVAVLLLCLGLLLGASWTVQALQPKLRRQAEERRRLNEEWSGLDEERSAIRIARQLGECSRCTSRAPERDWNFASGETAV